MNGNGKKQIKIVFIGTSELGVPALRLFFEDPQFIVTGVVTQPDKPAGRGLELKEPEVKKAARELGLPCIQPPSLRVPEVIAQIKGMEPDVIATAAYGLWIPEEVFDMTPKRCLNLHPSLLPRHRGAAPAVSALIDGDREAGNTALFVEDEMDAGDILGQMIIPISNDETAESLMAKSTAQSGEFFVEVVRDWMEDRIVPAPQDHEKMTWFGRMEKSFGEIDWNLSAVELERRVRALTPWPGAFTQREGKRLIIHRASVYSSEVREDGTPETGTPGVESPGRLITLGKGRAGVVTGDGVLELEEVQLECRRRMDMAEFLKGQKGFAGQLL